MKFWKRIFIYSMTLFLIIFNSASILIVENIHKRTINRTVKMALDEHKGTADILYLNADSLQGSKSTVENQLKDWLTLVITGYVSYDTADPNYIEVFDEKNNLVFSNSNLQVEGSRPEVSDAKLKERTFIIRKVQANHYLFVSSILSLQGNQLNLVLIKNINFIYEDREQNYKFFLFLDCFIIIILGLGMFLIAKKVTEPIVKLSEVSREIAHGDYSRRVEMKNKRDEVGVLAENFNIMVEASEATIKELQDASNAKQRFIDSLTHELKTPLTSIIGYSDLLLKGNVNEEIRFKSLNYINSEARRLEKLSFTLVKLLLIKQEDIKMLPVSLKECISTACKTLSYKLENKNISLRSDITDITFSGDKQLIIVLLLNILDNAIKASPNSGTIELKTASGEEAGEYILTIKDYGSGIPKEDMDKIKEPFYMVDKARDRAASGVGLGLAICDEICKLHSIDFEIESTINEGTLVLLNLKKENHYDEKES
ncbi:MAG: HAMP domain-containing sensor histidine kinase [Bacillota bacterium]|nr:HAMP domain-containing sensor histidine kinase [Bacillota bacterium]